jgi:cyclopropane fatty-acyl-phospholipid synthase-like methyltransferase
MIKLELIELKDQIKKTCELKNPKLINSDSLWKQNVILKFLEENNIEPKRILDIGAGCTNVSLYLIREYGSEYVGVDHSAEGLLDFNGALDLNEIKSEKIEYVITDFLEYQTDKKFDLVYDICSIAHFDPSKEITANDGFFLSGKIVNSVLEDGGYFICSTDCHEVEIPNHRGEINIEYISPGQIIEAIERSGFELMNDPFFLSSSDINTEGLNGISLDKIEDGVDFDYAHKDFYDRVFLVFKKLK